jgi:hypothetical protein
MLLVALLCLLKRRLDRRRRTGITDFSFHAENDEGDPSSYTGNISKIGEIGVVDQQRTEVENKKDFKRSNVISRFSGYS